MEENPPTRRCWTGSAFGSVGWTIPPRGRGLIAVDETAEKVNGREVYVGRDGRGHRGAPSHKGDVDQDFMDAPSSS